VADCLQAQRYFVGEPITEEVDRQRHNEGDLNTSSTTQQTAGST
jgi:hypothetical protein